MRLFSPRQNLRYIMAYCWLLCVLLAGFLAPSALTSPDLYRTSQPPFQHPYWFGTDPQGMDVGVALLQGARTVLLVSFPASILTLVLGTILGSIAGFWGNSRLQAARGWILAAVTLGIGAVVMMPQVLRHPAGIGAAIVLGSALIGWSLSHTTWGRRPLPLPLDTVVAGMIALLDSVPLLILVLVIAAVQRPSLLGLVLLMTLTCWTTPARIMRAATLQVREQAYIEAARMSGIPNVQLLLRHVWPNTWRSQLIRLPLTMALLIGLETTLSFLGVGLPPDTPSWGRLLAAVRLDPSAWWLLVWPGIALSLTLLSLQTLSSRK